MPEVTSPATSMTRLVDSKYAYGVLSALHVVYLFNQLDKLIYAPLTPSIEEDLSLSDSQMGFLTGPAVTWFFLVSTVFIARAADSMNRVRLLSAGLFFWSLATGISALCKTYWQLVLARIFFGLAEASCNPPAYSILSDYFTPERRGFALGIYTLGLYLGEGIGYSFGGWMAEEYGWRWTLVSIAAPGALFAVFVFFTLREPVRGMSEKDKVPHSALTEDTEVLEVGTTAVVTRRDSVVGTQEQVTTRGDGQSNNKAEFTFKQSLLMFVRQRAAIALSCAAGVRTFSGYALGFWIVSFYDRVHGVDTGKTGAALAVLVPVAGGLGVLVGGRVSDWWLKRNSRAQAYLPGISAICAVPFVMGAFLASSPVTSFIILFFAYLVAEMWIGPAVALLQRLVPPGMRGTTSAIYLFVTNGIGSCGTLFVGLLNDQHEDKSWIRYSLMIAVGGGYVLAFIGFVITGLLLDESVFARAVAGKPSGVPVGSIGGQRSKEGVDEHTILRESEFVPTRT